MISFYSLPLLLTNFVADLPAVFVYVRLVARFQWWCSVNVVLMLMYLNEHAHTNLYFLNKAH